MQNKNNSLKFGVSGNISYDSQMVPNKKGRQLLTAFRFIYELYQAYTMRSLA